jgi:hypothetical protein
MRRQAIQRHKRRELLWAFAGFLFVQFLLAVAIDTYWPAIRDPDWNDLLHTVISRKREAPTRPLFLAIGSSRTEMALCAGRLNDPADQLAPVVINCAVQGGGPMLDHIVLRRLFAAGIRPQLVFIEAMPLQLSRRDGTPVEERQKFSARYSGAEIAHLWPYYAQPYRLWLPWLTARLIPCSRHQVELRDALGIDLDPAQQGNTFGRDAFGWAGCRRSFSAQEVERHTQASLSLYANALTQPSLAPGAVAALRDAIHLCQVKDISVVLIAPPEGTPFRSFAPGVAEIHMDAVRRLAQQMAVPLIDARDWVADDGFWDGHHTTREGAERYTERFRHEVLIPYRGYPRHWTARASLERTPPGSGPMH